MSIRAILRSPFTDEVLIRDVAEGRWVESGRRQADIAVGEGLWALPGLVDSHAHLAVGELRPGPGDLDSAFARAEEALRAGVTLLIDKGWGDTTTLEVARALPPVNRPEIEAAGRILTVPGGYFPDFAREIDRSEIAPRVGEAAAEGLGWVKLIGDWPRKNLGPVANFTEGQLRAAVKAAEEAGSRVAVHTMAPEVPSMAVAAGVHSIEHGLFLDEHDVAVLGARGGSWVPTILRMEATRAQLGAGSSGGRLIGQGLDNVRRLLSLAVDAGVFVLAGTDLAVAPWEVGSEALKLMEYGLDPAEAVRAVSVAGFDSVERDSGFGVGSWADAVFFARNPIRDPEVLARPELIMRMGRFM